MAIVGDPLDSGIVASYSRPGGNITGSSFFFPEINAKRLELMKSLMPGLKRAGVLMHPDNIAMTSVLRALDEVAKAMDVKLQHVEVRRLDELIRPLRRPNRKSKHIRSSTRGCSSPTPNALQNSR